MLSEHPTVSILLHDCSSGVFLRRALRSVLMQTINTPIEIILIDEALPEGGVGIARGEMAGAGRAATHLRVFRPEAGIPPATALAAALQTAQGRFFHLLPSGTWWSDPEKLRRQVALLEAYPDLAGVTHRTILRSAVDGTEIPCPATEPDKPVLGLEDLLAGGPYFHPGAVLYRNRFATAGIPVPAVVEAVPGGEALLHVHAALGSIWYLPCTMSMHDARPDDAPCPPEAPGQRALTRALYDHGYLDAPGHPVQAADLARRLADIGAAAPVTLRPLSLYPETGAGQRQRLTAVTRITGLPDLETQLAGLTAAGEYDNALALIRAFLTTLAHDPTLARTSRMRRLCGPEIDAHCAAIGARIGAARGVLPSPCNSAAAAQGPLVIVVSGLAEDHDGPWAQTIDMIDIWRGRVRIVILSSETLPSMADAQTRLGADVEILLNTDHTLADKTAWLMWHLARLQPSQVLVNPAHNDVVIAAGLHRNHGPHIHLVERGAAGFVPCRQSDALDGVVVRRPHDMAYARKMSPDRQVVYLPHAMPPLRDGATPPAAHPLVTGTAGHDGTAFDGWYDYGLDLVIPLALASGAIRHVHVGDLSQPMLDRIHCGLARHGSAPGAFIHLPWTGDPGTALRGAGANLILQGAPRPDIRAVVSAMAAGLPVIAHRSYLHPMLSIKDLCPPSSAEWADPAGLQTILRAATPAWITAQTTALRAHTDGRTTGDAIADSAEFMHPVAPGAIPDITVPENRDELRRLMSELLETTFLCG